MFNFNVVQLVQVIFSNFPQWEAYFIFLCISINEVCDKLVLVLDRVIYFPVFSEGPFNKFLTCFVSNDTFIVN